MRTKNDVRTKRQAILSSIAIATLCLGTPILAEAPSKKTLELRNRGLAELENEKPADAEGTFREMIKIAPEEPLGYGNLAIATLRQQKFAEAMEWIEKALDKAPKDPLLLAIRGEVYQWSGNADLALASFRQAAEAAPNDLQVQYALYRQATTQGADNSDDAAIASLTRLAQLRPENLVVLLQLGARARTTGDRAAATAAYLRVRELIWQAPRGGEELLQQVLDALEAGDLESMRVPAQRLENVLKITPMYRESLRELAVGIQGVPLHSLKGEPEPEDFGEAVEVRFRTEPVGESREPIIDIAVADFDNDEIPDIAALVSGNPVTLELLLSSAGDGATHGEPSTAAGAERLLVVDLDNDSFLDLIGYGADGIRLWRGSETGIMTEATDSLGIKEARGSEAATVIDFDIEGDLDLVVVGSGSAEIYRNSLTGALEAVGAKSLPKTRLGSAHEVLASDLDRDGDMDLLLAHGDRLTWFDNLRQGRFTDRSEPAGLEATAAPGVSRLASADFDNDGWPDIVSVGKGVRFWRNEAGRFASWNLGEKLRTSAEMTALAVFDADNDGLLDLAMGGPGGLAIVTQAHPGELNFVPAEAAPAGLTALIAADLDRDGDLDLVAGGQNGLHRLVNDGGNQNRWLSVRLRGLDKGNSKNNFYGVGSSLEIKAGSAYQFREALTDVTHFGLGKLETPDLLRVVWSNGVPQNRLEPTASQWIVEEQLLKGSCPFLYTWTGDGFEFATDLLWGAPAGLPMGEGKWMPSDPEELVKIERISPRDGRYELQITEELWEAAFFDFVRLWVVDHPQDVEVASTLKILPGALVPEGVLGSRGLQPVAAAWDAAGRNVTELVRDRDEIYADGWKRSRYQGVPREPWTFVFDLGVSPDGPIRLHLDGWIFPTDASLNMALDQGQDIALFPPRLEVETESGWHDLLPNMGFPAGKTKTMVVDTPPLPAGATKLRIVGSQWLSWDRIRWTKADRIADTEPLVQGRLEPLEAQLHYRGFSKLVRQAPNAPHAFEYAELSTDSPWLPFPGRYTRYGDVRPLLAEADDLSVILGPGDEMSVSFDATHLPSPPEGWRRTIFLESHGWDKDADRNTFEPQHLEPLPFKAMSAYGDPFPDTPAHREYVRDWLTRVVEPETPGAFGERTATRLVSRP